MGVRLYPRISDDGKALLVGVPAEDLQSFAELVRAHRKLQVAVEHDETRPRQCFGYELHILTEAIPTLARYKDLELYGFGRFDLNLLLPSMDSNCGEIDINHPLAAALFNSTGSWEYKPTFAKLRAAGCDGFYWC